MPSRGLGIARARRDRRIEGDCRVAATIPPMGSFVGEVRDLLYEGGEGAAYRLRATETPYATAAFPLGGPAGQEIDLVLSGGSLPGPVRKRVLVPGSIGERFDPGPADGVDCPTRLVVGDGREVVEGPGVTTIGLDQTANGRIGARREVDRYRVVVKAGSRFRIKVDAERLGSMLDSVLTVRGAEGAELTSNDDGPGDSTRDSRIDFAASRGGPILIEVADRFGEGGVEYGDRLAVGSGRPDVAVRVVFDDGGDGGFNLVAGESRRVDFEVEPTGRPGPVTVRVESLPPGLSAEPTRLAVPGPDDPAEGPRDAMPKRDRLLIVAEPGARPIGGSFRVVATAEPSAGASIVRRATARVAIVPVPGTGGTRPVGREVDPFHVRVLGTP